LAILTAVEKVDSNVDEVVKEFVKHVKDIAGQVKADKLFYILMLIYQVI